MRIALFRVLGNDLPPRHQEGQTVQNLKYILENEATFDDVTKFFVLNRILDPEINEECARLIQEAGHQVYSIEFNPGVYGLHRTFEDKFGYITNNNGARNFCLEIGFDQQDFDVVLPFDGNCFFTVEGWAYFLNEVKNNYYSPYFIVPMARCHSYECLGGQPMVREMYRVGRMAKHEMTEPQIAFGKDHDLRFNPDRRYSEAPKVDLLWRLGIPGIWDYFYQEPGGLCQQALKNPSKFIERQPIYAGYVFRLPSGNSDAENDNAIRGAARQEGLRRIVDQADALVSA